MLTYEYGPLHGVWEHKRIIAVKGKRQIKYFYLPRSMFRSFMMYFHPGIYVFLHVENAPYIYKGVRVRRVRAVEKLMLPRGQNPKMYYDIDIIKSGIRSVITAKRPKLFIDFEMSMPPYRRYENFVSEIIQTGFILTDGNGKVLEERRFFIKPTLFPKISLRTKKFLRFAQTEVDRGKPYPAFHRMLKNMIRRHRPMVFVWGKNDREGIRRMNKIHDLMDFTDQIRFIDLLKLHKTYFGLKNDLGLFNAHRAYYDEPIATQKHDAFEDAKVTKQVFDAFVDACVNKKDIDFKAS